MITKTELQTLTAYCQKMADDGQEDSWGINMLETMQALALRLVVLEHENDRLRAIINGTEQMDKKEEDPLLKFVKTVNAVFSGEKE